MNQDHYKRDNCRLCGSKDLSPVLKIKPTPPANELLSEAQLNVEQEKFPLDVYFCKSCKHVQLLDVVNPERLFRNYVYVSGTSETFRNHFKEYASYIKSNFEIENDSLVLDIGSNDGTLLSSFKELGLNVLGVDPAVDIAKRATESGIETLGTFFTQEVAKNIVKEKGKAKVVVANNVFAHIDDLTEILKGIDIVLEDEGIFSIEVSYLKDVLEKTLFDTIYHEHLDYHSVGPLKEFFENNGFELIDSIEVSSHGGSLRAIAKKKAGTRKVSSSVAKMIMTEDKLGLYQEQTYIDFNNKINQLGSKLTEFLKNNHGKKVAGFGLPAKATTLMHHFSINGDNVGYIVDDNPLKQNLYSPGYKIPILPSSKLTEDKPDIIIILAWNFADPIIKKLEWFIQDGGTVVVPLPEFKIVSKS